MEKFVKPFRPQIALIIVALCVLGWVSLANDPDLAVLNAIVNGLIAIAGVLVGIEIKRDKED